MYNSSVYPVLTYRRPHKYNSKSKYRNPIPRPAFSGKKRYNESACGKTELKCIDTEVWSAENLTTSGNIEPLVLIGQGNNINQRTGLNVNVKSILAHLHVTRASADQGAKKVWFQMRLVYDKIATGTTPAVTDIVNDVDPRDTLGIPIYSINSNRFETLRIIKFAIEAGSFDNTMTVGIGDSKDLVVYTNLNKKGKSYPVKYDQTTTADWNWKQFYLVILTYGYGASYYPVGRLNTRVRFTDC